MFINALEVELNCKSKFETEFWIFELNFEKQVFDIWICKLKPNVYKNICVFFQSYNCSMYISMFSFWNIT
jgi:hypothetical protein